MKRFFLIAVLAGALMVLLAGTALAAGPVTPPSQGFGRGMRMWGADAAAPTADCPCGMAGAQGAQGRGKPAWAGQPDEVAALLGMTADEIRAERQAGKSLAQIAATKGVSEDKLIGTILDAKKAILAKLVADGKLTQAQADLMVEHMQTQIKTMVERTTVGPMQGRQGMGEMRGSMGRSGRGQGFRGGQGANQ